MTDTNCAKLDDLFANKRKAGLLDVKFYIVGTDEASYEEVCAELAGLYDAVDKGASEPLRFVDSRVQ